MNRFSSTLLQVLSAAILCVPHGTAFGQPLRLVVPFAAGGGGDRLARLLSPALSRELGISVFVENLPGANGAVGMQRVARAAPTDHVLVLASDHAAVVAPLNHRLIGYDTRTTFAMAGFVARHRYALAVSTSSGIKSFQELAGEVRTLAPLGSVAVPAEGGLPELISSELSKLGCVEITVVPFLGGGPATSALLAGQVSAAAVGLGNVIALHRAGRLRILAVSGDRRSPAAPEIPTFSEQGATDLSTSSGWAFFAVKSTTMDLIKFNQALRKVLSQTPIRNQLLSIGMEPDAMGIEESKIEFEKTFETWARVMPSRVTASPSKTSSPTYPVCLVK